MQQVKTINELQTKLTAMQNQPIRQVGPPVTFAALAGTFSGTAAE